MLAEVSAWALVQIQPASAEVAAETVPLLSTALSSPLPAARRGAAEALGALGPLAKSAADALKRAADDEDPAVAKAATEALKAVSSPKTKPAAAEGTVVTLQDGVDVMVGKLSIAKLPKGTSLRVLSTQGVWIGVAVEIDGQRKTGWVMQSQVGKP